MPEEQLQALMDFYYKRIREALSGMTEPYVMLHGLGTFIFKGWKADQYIQTYENKAKKIRGTAYGYIKEGYLDKVDKITRVKYLYDSEKQRKYDYKREKYNKKNSTDSAGDIQ